MDSKGLIIRTNSPNETQNLAESLSPFLAAGDVISLCGDLGAGKTCFTQGLAKGLGIGERVTSPTFNLIKEYRNTLPLYHFDVYRLKKPEELYDIGYEEYFYGEGVTVIEWGEKVSSFLPDVYLRIELKRLLEENARELRITYRGERWKDVVEKWKKTDKRYSTSD